MTPNEIRALADANAEVNRKGLQRAGRCWYAERHHSTGHDYNTIMSLVDRGYLRLWGPDQVAHITDSGIEELAFEVDKSELEKQS